MSLCTSPPTIADRPSGPLRSCSVAVAFRFLPVLLALALVGAASPVQAQDQKAERNSQMQERRAERLAKAHERREQLKDPEFVRKSAWWNQEANVADLDLSTSQRKAADAALIRFVNSRAERQEAGTASQKAFFAALGTDAPAVDLAKVRDAMVEALAANALANADLRIAVMTVLSSEQRAKIATDKARLLRTDWAGGRTAGQQQLRQARPNRNGSPRN